LVDSPNSRKSTKPLERPKTRKQVEGWIVEGITDAEIARRVGVHRSAVGFFRRRHAASIAPAIAEIERRIEDAAIADKVRRILDADADYQKLGQVIEARASDTRYDEPGYQTGVMVHTLKQIGTGKNAELVDEYKVDTAVIAERRALRREVAEALDALPRGTDKTAIQVNVGVAVSLRWDDGELVSG
jgi:hypothetical protein